MKSKMPSMRVIRAALREKYGARQYRVSHKNLAISTRENGRWLFKGYADDAVALAMACNIGPLALTANDFK